LCWQQTGSLSLQFFTVGLVFGVFNESLAVAGKSPGCVGKTQLSANVLQTVQVDWLAAGVVLAELAPLSQGTLPTVG
jgi:hypothetical protein